MSGLRNRLQWAHYQILTHEVVSLGGYSTVDRPRALIIAVRMEGPTILEPRSADRSWLRLVWRVTTFTALHSRGIICICICFPMKLHRVLDEEHLAWFMVSKLQCGVNSCTRVDEFSASVFNDNTIPPVLTATGKDNSLLVRSKP